MSFDDFVGYIMAANIEDFNDESRERRILAQIERWSEFDDTGSALKWLTTEKIQTYQRYLERSNNIQDDRERVLLVFELEGINFEENGNDLLLNYYTSMHNDFNSGMNDTFKEIILYFLFDVKKEMSCERIDDSM